jgi:hypothetical protein
MAGPPGFTQEDCGCGRRLLKRMVRAVRKRRRRRDRGGRWTASNHRPPFSFAIRENPGRFGRPLIKQVPPQNPFSKITVAIESGIVQRLAMAGGKLPFAEDGRRLRLLRQAEGYDTAWAFAQYMGWSGSAGISQFETGQRRVPIDKALQLRDQIPGFDPVWLWTGDRRGLSFDLRKRIEAEEKIDAM